jgi:hypothetical protein
MTLNYPAGVFAVESMIFSGDLVWLNPLSGKTIR